MRAGRRTEGRPGWGGIRHATELGLVAGVASALAVAAVGPTSRLASWHPGDAAELAGAPRPAIVGQAPDPNLLAQLPSLAPPPADPTLDPSFAWPPTSPAPLLPAPPGATVTAPPRPAPPIRLPTRSSAPTPAPTPASRRSIPVPTSTSRPAPPVPPAPPIVSPAPPVDADLSGAAAQTFAGLNQDRTQNGLSRLRADAALTRAAFEHAAQIAATDQLSHAGYVDDVNAQGVSWSGLGEVLGGTVDSPDASTINQLWMQSPEHRPIILDPRYTGVGIGWAESPSGWWYVSAILMY